MTYEHYEEKISRLRSYINKLEKRVEAFKSNLRYQQQATLIKTLQRELEYERERNDTLSKSTSGLHEITPELGDGEG